jgi:hypothetical protein
MIRTHTTPTRKTTMADPSATEKSLPAAAVILQQLLLVMDTRLYAFAAVRVDICCINLTKK